MDISITNKTKTNFSEETIKKITELFLLEHGRKLFEVSIVFVGDKTIRTLNKNYRNKDKITDVLSFEGEDMFLGEIIIDLIQIKRQASRYDNKFEDELNFILVHGLLHLLGHTDETEEEEEKMIRLGESFLEKIKNKI